MIVDPDFLDHWRTRMVVDALGGDQMAPMYVIRIWAHCQSRRASRFEKMPAAGLKALCRAPCDAEQLERALVDAEFITRDGDAIEVPKWAEANAKLIANWENGGKGGRPKRTDEEPNDNPTETHGEPTDNQSETHSEPIGGEGSREEETLKPKSKAEQRATRLPADWEPSEADIEFCRAERKDLDHRITASRFKDYWIAEAGAKGRKLDWSATWRNWVRNERGGQQARAGPAAPEKFDPVAHVNRNRI